MSAELVTRDGNDSARGGACYHAPVHCGECQADLPDAARFCLSCGARVERAAPDATIDPLREALTKAIGFQYQIERLLGRGGMGAVYLAHELALDRDVAIKVLPPEQAGASDVRERFRREARTAARLSHQHIVPLYTFGEVSGLVYFVMGYVKGESLASRLERQGPLDSEAARTLIAGVADALAYAHRLGVVHRDIKPDNVLIDAESGAPLLTDFGIAKATITDAQQTTAQLTTAGQLVGTPHYMSPEQAMGQPDVGPASDLYSLGVVAYEIVSGVRPFAGQNPMDVLTQRLTRDPKPLTSVAPEVAPDLAQVIMRCLQRDPANRWPDARSLREALMPSEEEPEFSPPVRVLQTVTTVVLPLTVLAIVHVRLFAALNPDFTSADRLTAALISLGASLPLLALVMVVRLRAEGRTLGAIARKAVEQPSWWRAWYPRSLRRRGDVWDRLPREARQYRAVKGLLLTYAWAAFVPIYFMSTWVHRFATLRLLLFAGMVIGLVLMFRLRRRAVTAMQAKAGGPLPDAAALLNTPTWRTSVWRRTPTGTTVAGPSAKR